jgi:hypothetical protein
MLGDVRVHAVGASAGLDLVFGLLPSHPQGAEVRLGVGAEWLGATAVARSAHGFDEPTTRVWALLGDAHSFLAFPLRRAWSTSFGMAIVKDLRGISLRAGGEDAISLHGWGLGAEARAEWAF